MDQEHVSDLLAGYALDILDADEAKRVAAHLEACAACSRELAGFRLAAAELPAALELHAPPAALRERILSAAATRPPAVKDALRPAQPEPGSAPVSSYRPRKHAPARKFGLTPAWAAVGLIVIAALLFANVAQWIQVRRMQSQASLRTVALLPAEASGAATGTLVISMNGEYGVLVTDHLPPLDPNKQYQLWLIHDGMRDSGGVFSVNTEGYGTLLVSSPRPLADYQAVGVTVEPYGGSPGPTGARVLGGDL